MDATTQTEGVLAASVPARDTRSLALVAQVLGWAAWVGLVGWKLGSVPGMHMDEAWYILSTRGQWESDNPLSGLTSYAGPFPLLLLKLFGTNSGLLVLRVASLLANGLTLVLLAVMLGHLYPARVLRCWALPLIATTPVWLVTIRTAFEISIFTPLLSVLGLFLLTLGAGWSAFAAGLSWGLLVYNHLIGAYFPMSLLLAWLVVYRRLPRIQWLPALAGFGLGIAPRLFAVALYRKPLDPASSAGHYSFAAGVADLKELPLALWETLLGRTVYIGSAGRLAVDVWPYWAPLALLFFLPWVRRLRSVPKHAWFTLITAMIFAGLATVGSPYMGVRFFILWGIGIATFLVQLGASAIQLSLWWSYAMRAAAGALVACNLFYLVSNFYVPWHKRELGISFFRLGARSPYTSTWGYLPKEGIEQKLRTLEPPPEQILSNASLNRPLRALLGDTGIRIRTWDEADKSLRTVYVEYNYGNIPARPCLPVPNGTMCFRKPEIVDQYFVLYR